MLLTNECALYLKADNRDAQSDNKKTNIANACT